MITPLMRISYPALFEAKVNPSGVLKFSCSLLISKTDVKGVEVLEAAIAKAIAIGKEKIWKGRVPNFRFAPLRDGDAELASGEKVDPIYAGIYFLNCSSNEAPGVVGPTAELLLDRSAIFAGCWVRADINPFPYSNSGNNGVGWGLNHVMLVREDTRLDGRVKAEDAFSAFAETPAEPGNLM